MNNERRSREAAAFRDLARPGSALVNSGLALDWATPPNRSSLPRLCLLFARCWTTLRQTER